MAEQPKRILLVEDDRFLRKAAEATLRRHGFSVCTAADGEEALQHIQAETPDLVLLDLIMPKLQGFEVLRLMKQNPATKQIPVVVLSNLGQESDVQQALQGGAIAYLIKANLSLQDLVIQVQKFLTEGIRA
jgi:CheY-like chemotaxis protein